MREEWLFPNRATPPGSSAYYSVRFAPAALRDDVAALLAWRREVRAILEEVSDPGVARRKLQWWREELARTYAGDPRHPLSRVLQPAVERHGLPASRFEQIADGVEAELRGHQPADEAAMDRACDADQGALFELIARCHGLDGERALESARGLGRFCAHVYLIRNSGALVRRGRPILPVERLRPHGLSAEALTRQEHGNRLPALLAGAAKQARDGLAALGGVAHLPACTRVRAAILDALLAELARVGFDVADRRIGLTPVRKLWLGWRESRRL